MKTITELETLGLTELQKLITKEQTWLERLIDDKTLFLEIASQRFYLKNIVSVKNSKLEAFYV